MRQKRGRAGGASQSGGARGFPQRRCRFELLERRDLLSTSPLGAMPDDTAEYMLGDVLVTVVLMESSENTSFLNPNSETWNPSTIAAIKDKIVEGMTWWEDTLATEFPGTQHQLNFQYDFTYADNPVSTDYEPIANISDYFQYWIYDFLDQVGYSASGQFSSDIRAFNHAQRLNFGTDWAFTIFVANAENDLDGYFANGGSFSKAFSYPGGQFIVAPSTRPASTFAHETGHIFWARDEYYGGGSYTDQRGYYNAQNWNAANNPTPGFVQQDSIMASYTLLNNAYAGHTSSTSSLEMVGWKDSDGDGIFDLADIPLTLDGAGRFDAVTGEYHFVGSSSAQTTPNQNSSGLQNDITVTRVRRAEYRIDNGPWELAASYNDFEASLDLRIPIPDFDFHTVEVRTVDDHTGVTSAIFSGNTAYPTATTAPGLNGFVWDDLDTDGVFDNDEPGLAGWTVSLVDEAGTPLDWIRRIDPDDFASGTVLSDLDLATTYGLTLSAIGSGVDPAGQVAAREVAPASTGNRVFSHLLPNAGWSSSWTADRLSDTNAWPPLEPRQLRMDFTDPVSFVSLDAVGNSADDYARLEIYDASDNLLARYTTDVLNYGQVETMTLVRETPDIAYAIAKGHLATEGNAGVALDNLRFGVQVSATTDGLGTYRLTGLPSGQYLVRAESPPGSEALAFTKAVSVAEGETVADVNFGGHQATVSWQNPNEPADVTGEGNVTPMDVLTLINYINSRVGVPDLPVSPNTPPPYLDVDGDGLVTASDVLWVINTINQRLSGEQASRVVEVGGGGEGEIPLVAIAAAFERSTALPKTIESLAVPADRNMDAAASILAIDRDRETLAWNTAADLYHSRAAREPRANDLLQSPLPQADDLRTSVLDPVEGPLGELHTSARVDCSAI